MYSCVGYFSPFVFRGVVIEHCHCHVIGVLISTSHLLLKGKKGNEIMKILHLKQSY